MRLSLVGRWVQGCRHSGLNLLDWCRYGYFNRAYHLGNSCLAFKELNLVSAESQCLLHLAVQVFQVYDDFVHWTLTCYKESNYELNPNNLIQNSLLCLLGLLNGTIVFTDWVGGLWILIFLINHGLLIDSFDSAGLHVHGELSLGLLLHIRI